METTAVHADVCEGMECTHGSKCVAAPDGKASCQCVFECHAEATEKLCGTDGRTYRNRCEFDQRLCSHQDDTRIKYNGSCGTCLLVPLIPFETSVKRQLLSFVPYFFFQNSKMKLMTIVNCFIPLSFTHPSI